MVKTLYFNEKGNILMHGRLHGMGKKHAGQVKVADHVFQAALAGAVI